ncbi:tetratricopeptide repeat protein, partial [Acinetobacter baumannii]
IASFYLSIESGREAARIAERVLEIEQNSAAAYVTIGMANRIDFDLEKAEAAYQKAVDLAPSDKTARRGLADIRRALGKSDSATEIYRSLVAEDEN